MTPTSLRDRLLYQERTRSQSQAGLPPRVEIDWQEYFKRFCDLHGRFPLVYQGRLLFPDAWTYSATDYAGPEWPPPANASERIKLMRTYWKLRRSAIRRELLVANEQLLAVEALLAERSAKPAVRTTFVVPETGKATSSVSDLDATPARERVLWLEDDLRRCELMIVDPEGILQ